LKSTPNKPSQGSHNSSFIGAWKRQRKLIILTLVACLAFGYFIFTALQGATAYYYTVDELVAMGPGTESQSIQVKGSLVDGTFIRLDEDSTLAEFQLEENGYRISASYDGVVPDLFFNPHSEIVLNGRYVQNELFITDRILVKCPSKYQSQEEEAPLKYP
jgi:cytochrome c-type biogenesis protein CcmE